jgi:AcrR family transcriptional regulator
MVYRRTHQVVKRLAARRSAILAAARSAAADGGMAAVQIAPVAVRANVAAGTVYRYFPSKADLISELIADVSRDELAAIRRAADAAPGPSSALAAAVTTVAVHVLSQRKLAWGILAEPVDVDVTASRLASRREISGEIAARIEAAVRAGHLPAQDTALAATALLGALHESLVGPLAPDNLEDPAKMRDAVQTVTLLALRAVGVMDARARGLVVQAVLPAKATPLLQIDAPAGHNPPHYSFKKRCFFHPSHGAIVCQRHLDLPNGRAVSRTARARSRPRAAR